MLRRRFRVASSGGIVIAVLSIIISSIALLGVAYGLTLQALQLRANQLQVSRSAQFEIVKLVIDNPELISGAIDPSDHELVTRAGAFLNCRIKQLELSYSVKATSAAGVRLQARLLFSGTYPIEWWSMARGVYASEAATRRERRFFALVDNEYMRVLEQLSRPPIKAADDMASPQDRLD